MKKNGFTLVELMAVIIILGILALITVPIINRTLKNSRESLYKEQVAQIESAAKSWGSQEIDKLDNSEDGVYFLSISELQNSGYLEDSEILDPRDKTKMDGCVVVRLDEEYNQYIYKYSSDSCADSKESFK